MRLMGTPEDVAAVEAEIKAAGQNMAGFLKAAGIHVTTWRRWKRGTVGPTTKNWTRVQQARAAVVGERAA